MYPPTPLAAELQANIAFSSLPEGDMPTAGAHMYSWTIPIPQTPKDLEPDEGVAKDAVPDVDGNLYGVVYFVAEKVRISPRWMWNEVLMLVHIVQNECRAST